MIEFFIDDHPFIGFIFCMLLLIGGATGIVSGIYATVDPISCRSTAQAMQLEYRWGFWTSCMVRDGDRFVPMQTYQDAYARRHQSIHIEGDAP